MQAIILEHEADFDGWRAAARRLALSGVPPEGVVWSVRAADDLFAVPAPEAPAPSGTFSVSRAFVELAEQVIQARDPERFALLYALLWRTQHGERALLEDAADPMVGRATRLAQAVRRDIHKMRAFVRFREVREPVPAGAPDGPEPPPRYVAWFEPEHYIVEGNAPFFVRRFATMTWSVLTPYRSAHWDGERLAFADGADPADVPDDDALARYWQAYFSAIFNPARLKISAMTSEMPRKYWRNLPEAAAIPELIRGARGRTDQMVQHPVLTDPKERRMPRPPLPPAGGPDLLDAGPGGARPGPGAPRRREAGARGHGRRRARRRRGRGGRGAVRAVGRRPRPRRRSRRDRASPPAPRRPRSRRPPRTACRSWRSWRPPAAAARCGSRRRRWCSARVPPARA